MPTKRQLAAIELYADLMNEVKVRLASIDTSCNNLAGFPGPLVREFCFLQLRMICELVALGCLAAHGDIEGTQSKKFSKEYSADRILMLLENLHSEFYPKPVTMKPLEPHKHHLKEIKVGFLSKADLPRLYAKCGGVLHRGNIKKLLSDRTTVQFSLPEIKGWTKKIYVLLNAHRILLIGGKTAIVCTMHSVRTGKVQVALAGAVE